MTPSHLSTGTVAQVEEALKPGVVVHAGGFELFSWRLAPARALLLRPRGLWANSGRYGLGFLLGYTQVEVQEHCREGTERGEYGVDDYSERCCTSARVTASGGR